MFQIGSKIRTLFSMAAFLCLLAALSGSLTPGLAAEPAASASEHPGPMNLVVADGKLSGRFNDRPLAEILDFISGIMGFEYQASHQLGAERVSHEFDRVPLMDATKQLLAPFGHFIEFHGNGRIKHIFISGKRNAPRGTPQLHGQLDGQKDQGGKGPDRDRMKVSPSMELEDASTQGSGPPPELIDLFYPQQEPGTELTGPPVLEGHATQEFNHFVPTEHDSGPEALETVKGELPEFEPVISETGP